MEPSTDRQMGGLVAAAGIWAPGHIFSVLGMRSSQVRVHSSFSLVFCYMSISSEGMHVCSYHSLAWTAKASSWALLQTWAVSSLAGRSFSSMWASSTWYHWPSFSVLFMKEHTSSAICSHGSLRSPHSDEGFSMELKSAASWSFSLKTFWTSTLENSFCFQASSITWCTIPSPVRDLPHLQVLGVQRLTLAPQQWFPF